MKKVLFIITFVISALGVNAAEFHTDSTFDTKSLLAEPSDILSIPDKKQGVVKTTEDKDKNLVNAVKKVENKENKKEENINNTDNTSEKASNDFSSSKKLTRKQKRKMKKLQKKEAKLRKIEEKRLEKEYNERMEYQLKMEELKAKQNKIDEEALKRQKKEELKKQKKEDEKKLKEYEKVQKVQDVIEKEELLNIQKSLKAEPWKDDKNTIDIYDQPKQTKELSSSEKDKLEDITKSILQPQEPKSVKKEVKKEKPENITKIEKEKVNLQEFSYEGKKLSSGDCKRALKANGIKYNEKSFLAEAEKNDTQNVAYFLVAGMQPDVKGESDTTPLIWASYNGNKQMMGLLIENGANVNWSNKDGFTPLMAAVERDNIEAIKYLLQKKAKVNVATIEDKTTPLHIACYNGSKGSVELLVVAGADVNAKNSKGITPLVTAIMYGNKDIVEYLKSQGANLENQNQDEIVLGSISNGNSSNIEILIDSGANINLADKNGKTLLHTAVINRDYKNTELLIKNGASVDAVMKNDVDSNLAPLHLAVISGDLNIAKLLSENGASKDVKEGNLGATPLDVSILLKNNDISDLLIKDGADINAVTNAGVTPADIALAVKDNKLLEEILSKGGLFGKETGMKFVKYGCSVQYKQDKDLYEISLEDAINTLKKYENDSSEMAPYKKYMDRTHKFRTERKEIVIDKHSFNIYPLLYGRI